MLDPSALTASDFEEALLALLPEGLAWDKEKSSPLREFWGGVAEEVARIQERHSALLRESVPTRSVELLADWERVLGLPDPCAPVDTTESERRRAVEVKLRSTGGAALSYFIGLAASLGYVVTIREHRPFVCGMTACGHQAEHRPVGSQTMRFFWTVTIASARQRWFQIGRERSQVGRDPHVALERATHIECLFARLKPAHTVAIFNYDDGF